MDKERLQFQLQVTQLQMENVALQAELCRLRHRELSADAARLQAMLTEHRVLGEINLTPGHNQPPVDLAHPQGGGPGEERQ